HLRQAVTVSRPEVQVHHLGNVAPNLLGVVTRDDHPRGVIPLAGLQSDAHIPLSHPPPSHISPPRRGVTCNKLPQMLRHCQIDLQQLLRAGLLTTHSTTVRPHRARPTERRHVRQEHPCPYAPPRLLEQGIHVPVRHRPELHPRLQPAATRNEVRTE